MAENTLWIDSHCHLQLDGTVPDALNRAVEAGVERLICVGTDAESSAGAVQIAVAAGERVKATVGLHPHDAKNELASTIAVLDEAIKKHDGIVVGIGECGLDYFYEHSPRSKQREVFAEQVQLAKKHDLALVVHTRDAWDETFDILRSENAPTRTVIHCFSGGIPEARKFLELGFCLSFSGIVTFKKAKEVQEAAQFCPTNRMLIETDSPFLAPIPKRGKPNEPANVGLVGEFISELKNVKKELFAKQIYESTMRLFNLSFL